MIAKGKDLLSASMSLPASLESFDFSMDLEESSLLVPPLSGEVKGFTLDDRRELFHLLAFLLTDQYQFYAIYNKYHGNIADRRLTPEKEAYAETYFDTSGVSCRYFFPPSAAITFVSFQFSPPYILTLAAVRENALLDRIQQCFLEAKPGIMPPQFASKLIHVLSTLKRLTNDQATFSKIYPAREAALKYVCRLCIFPDRPIQPVLVIGSSAIWPTSKAICSVIRPCVAVPSSCGLPVENSWRKLAPWIIWD